MIPAQRSPSKRICRPQLCTMTIMNVIRNSAQVTIRAASAFPVVGLMVRSNFAY